MPPASDIYVKLQSHRSNQCSIYQTNQINEQMNQSTSQWMN